MEEDIIIIQGFIFREEDFNEVLGMYRDLYPNMPYEELRKRTEGCLISNLDSWTIGAVKGKERE